MSVLDRVVKRLILTNFFGDGWGDQEIFHRLTKIRGDYQKLDYEMEFARIASPQYLGLQLRKEKSKHFNVYNGSFTSPLTLLYPGTLPKESERCNFMMILPKTWRDVDRKRVCLHYAATGDHGYWRRSNFIAQPLAKHSNIGSVIMENPFYGNRKPKGQVRSGIRQVSDLFIMGCALVLEGHFLFSWLEGQGYNRLGISGTSLGGHNASLTAAAYRKPIATVPCLSWSTAAHTFSEGIISNNNMWNVLREQLCHDKIEEIKAIIHKTDEDIEGMFLERYGKSLTPDSSSQLVVSTPVPSRKFSLSQLHYVSKVSNGIGSLTNTLVELRSKNSPDKLTSLYMRLVLDEFSNLKNYPVPVCQTAAIVVVAEDDLYITRPQDVLHIKDIWKECEVRVVKGGHVSSFIRHNGTFRQAIVDAFNRLDLHIEGHGSGREPVL